MGSDTGKPDVDAAADTEARPERSPSQQLLHDDVKAVLFEGASPRDQYDSGVVLGGRWRIVGLIGRGGMGEVYRARDLELGEDVAIKFLPRAYAHNPVLRARFVNEVRLARQITHPSVCRVHDIGEADGRHFLSMELIDGEDLSSLLRRIGRLPQEKALELAQQLCAGLAALHARGVLHRDLKPSNVMIDGEGRLKLADFGLAALEADLRPEELRDGTPAYMAPEQAAGKEVTVKSDIFALGLVLYELIAGRHAFASGSDPTGRPRIDRSATPASISTHVRGLPPELDDVIRACIDPDPAGRPASVLAVAAALPGGDPIAAALAAGRAPSVEAVAGAKVVGTLPAFLAYALAAIIAVGTLAFAAVQPMRSVLGQYEHELSVDVLVHRAREVLDRTGHAPVRGDFVVALRLDREFLDSSSADAVEPSASSYAPLLLVYRQSPFDLRPFGPDASVDDPPLTEPGGARIVLDGRGRLVALRLVPPERVPEPTPCDFDPLLHDAGLDPASLVETTPVATPLSYADERRAWTGTLSGTDIEVTVEAAALGGRPVQFEVYTPWRPVPAADDAEAADEGPGAWGEYAVTLLAFGLAALIVALARRSIMRGDADLRGAWRAAVVVTVLMGVATFFRGHHSGPFGELSLWAWLLRNSIFFGGITFLSYVIVEPYARRYLPGAMVGWTRLVRGQWRDHVVARDVLIGVAACLVLSVLQFVKSWVAGLPNAFAPLEALHGGRHVVGLLAQSGWISVYGILQLFFVYLVIAMLLRGRARATMLVFLVLWAIIEFPKPYTHESVGVLIALLMLSLAVAAGMVLLITRYGLLAAAATQLGASLLNYLPVTLDFDAWYAPLGTVAFAGIGAMTLFGLRCVRRGEA
jgi:serine/threonine-protein kinase